MTWKVGQTVMVQSRTWANINKPGGCAKITKVHTVDENDSAYVEGLDVKYIVGGGREKNLDPAIVAPFEGLERGGRSRRGRDFLVVGGKAPEKRNGAIAPVPAKENRTTSSHTKTNPKAPPLPEAMSAATCSTPEPPRHARKKLPKKVTPIPKMVVVPTRTTEADDISPMWMCADATATSSSRPIARRKHDSVQTNASDSKRKANNVARPLDFEASPTTNQASSKPHGGIPPPPTSLLASKRSSADTTTTTLQQQQQQQKRSRSSKPKHGGNGLAHRKQPPAPLQERQQHGGLVNPPKKKPPPSHPSSKRRQHNTQQTPTQPQHHKAKTKPHNQASFSRAISAYSSAGAKTSTSKHQHRMPLKDVYRREKEMARKFMDEMVGAPRTTGDDDKNDSSNPNSRYQEFLSHLYKVWMKVDGEEEISEDRFRCVYRQVSGGIFSATELETHLSSLCEEGRDVMRSDGMLYRIH